MKVDNIQSNTLSFGAKINLKSRGVAEYCEYLDRCKDAPEGWFSSNRNIALFSKICDAFEKHPSNEVLNTDVKYVNGGFCARGVVETSRGRIVDIEPSRDDDGTGPMQYLFRKLLDKDNKNIFNRLMGEEHSAVYDSWWDENIKPIKKDIDDLYNFLPTTGKYRQKDYEVAFNDKYKHGLSRPQRVVQEKTETPEPPIIENKPIEKKSSQKPFFERLKEAWHVLKGN